MLPRCQLRPGRAYVSGFGYLGTVTGMGFQERTASMLARASSNWRCAVTPVEWWHWGIYGLAIVVTLYAGALLMLAAQGVAVRGRSGWVQQHLVLLNFLAGGTFPAAGFVVYFLGGNASCV